MTAKWIYLSPHLDDAVLSCGGLIYEQAQAGFKPEIWTLTAGSPNLNALPQIAKQLHQEWGITPDAPKIRRAEDVCACQRLGAVARHLTWNDCIYRYKSDGEALIQLNNDIFLAKPEDELISEIAKMLHQSVPEDAQLIVPMSIGKHVDHHLTHLAAKASGLASLYYADYPYVTFNHEQINTLENGSWTRLPAVISEQGLLAWQEAILAYTSQLSTFWQNEQEVRLAITNYWAGGGGRLWKIQE